MSGLVRRYWKAILGFVVIAAALGACGAPISDGAGGAAGSVVGQVPSTLALLYLGDGASHGNTAAAWWIGLAVTAVGAVVIARYVQRAFSSAAVPPRRCADGARRLAPGDGKPRGAI